MTRHVAWDRGVVLPGHNFWLDPQVMRESAFISHAHSDHARRHRHALLTQETLALMPERRRPEFAQVLGYAAPHRLGGATVTLLPAGHMLGAAQILFEHDGSRLLYTGDLKLRLGQAKARTAIPSADVLVIESTYGRPQFRFPDPDTALETIARWCRRCLDSRVTPVLLAHALGKAQELMLALAAYGFEFALEERCMAYSGPYRRTGLNLPDHVQLGSEDVGDRVVIAPPSGKQAVRRLARYRCALVSGWAMDPHFWRLFGADVAFAYSDHCDFDELVEVAELSGASQVYTVHGFAEDLARLLRKRGLRASALNKTEQLALAI